MPNVTRFSILFHLTLIFLHEKRNINDRMMVFLLHIHVVLRRSLEKVRLKYRWAHIFLFKLVKSDLGVWKEWKNGKLIENWMFFFLLRDLIVATSIFARNSLLIVLLLTFNRLMIDFLVFYWFKGRNDETMRT